MLKKFGLFLFLIISLNFSVNADVRLAGVFSDNMVFQRERPIKIWGYSTPKNLIVVELNGVKTKAVIDSLGNWEAQLPPMKAGGPYAITVKEIKETLTLNNVMIGDVWLFSGQSNMEWNFENLKIPALQIEPNTNIRFITLPHKLSNKVNDDIVATKWEVCIPPKIETMSAVAYYFAQNLSKTQNIPVGIIVSAWGGTNIEPWISAQSLSKIPAYVEDLKNALPLDFGKMQSDVDNAYAAWQFKIKASDIGSRENWQLLQTDYSDWRTAEVPGVWEKYNLPDGIVWYTTEFELNEKQINTPVILSLDAIDDEDVTFINGVKVGETNLYSTQRKYQISPGVLKNGKNIIAVKITDNGLDGGFTGSKDNLFIEIGNEKIFLSGKWKYKPSFLGTAPRMQWNYRNGLPATAIYNSMIYPLKRFELAGVAWYQGESNTADAGAYKDLLKTMITDWRTTFDNKRLPFIVVQLSSFNPNNKAENWPLLREAQWKATKETPLTALVVTTDLGDSNNIHPADKKTVGSRIFNLSRRLVYRDTTNISSPEFFYLMRQGRSILVSFKNTGKGLKVSNNDEIKGFEVAGVDKKYYPATAKIVKPNQVLVTSDKVEVPLSVRYAWDNCPLDANLYNSLNLPLIPFKTEDH